MIVLYLRVSVGLCQSGIAIGKCTFSACLKPGSKIEKLYQEWQVFETKKAA